LRRNGLHYKAQTGFKSHWTKPHYAWLRRTIRGSAGSLQVNLSLLLRQIRGLDEALVEYGQHIEELAVTPRYQEAVQSLTCYKGIKNLFALNHHHRDWRYPALCTPTPVDVVEVPVI
jgi:hypothetical protein